MHQQYDVDLLGEAVKSVFPSASQKALDKATSFMKVLVAPTESDAWKELGNRLYEEATEAQDNSEAFTYCLFGGACLGRSVDFARAKAEGQ